MKKKAKTERIKKKKKAKGGSKVIPKVCDHQEGNVGDKVSK